MDQDQNQNNVPEKKEGETEGNTSTPTEGTN